MTDRKSTQDHFLSHFEEHRKLVQGTVETLGTVCCTAANLMEKCFRGGQKVLLCGNGGSASDAQHIAAELTGRYERPTRPPLAAISLATDTSALTALGNDFGFGRIFARQVEALGQAGDVLIAISTSGNSENVIEAVSAASQLGMTTIGLLGRDGGALADLVDLAIIVPSESTAHIQEMHITIGHFLCAHVDQQLAEQHRD